MESAFACHDLANHLLSFMPLDDRWRCRSVNRAWERHAEASIVGLVRGGTMRLTLSLGVRPHHDDARQPEADLEPLEPDDVVCFVCTKVDRRSLLFTFEPTSVAKAHIVTETTLSRAGDEKMERRLSLAWQPSPRDGVYHPAWEVQEYLDDCTLTGLGFEPAWSDGRIRFSVDHDGPDGDGTSDGDSNSDTTRIMKASGIVWTCVSNTLS